MWNKRVNVSLLFLKQQKRETTVRDAAVRRATRQDVLIDSSTGFSGSPFAQETETKKHSHTLSDTLHTHTHTTCAVPMSEQNNIF